MSSSSSSNKRRKLNVEVETKNISAFAARQQRKLAEAATSAAEAVTKSDDPDELNGLSFVAAGKASKLFRLGIDGDGGAKGEEGEFSDSSVYEGQNEEIETGRSSRGTNTPKQSVVQFTTARSGQFTRQPNDAITIKMAPGERVVALGEYDLWVKKGVITILGATLSAGSVFEHTTVYAPSSHSLPVIRYLESLDNEVIIQLSGSPTRLRGLRILSPLFSRLWNETSTPIPGKDMPDRMTSFQILFSSTDGPKKIPLHKVYSPPEWNETFAALCSGKWNRVDISSTMICGPKSSGKSTFAKLLMNRLMTLPVPMAKNATKWNRPKPTGVLLLDLDPGQPEYSPPGQLSLVHLQRPNLGPPYAHPEPNRIYGTVVRAHAVCAISPSADSDHYMACVSDLLSHYRHFISSRAQCPLIINTPGWILGTGLELLLELIKKAKPTAIVYMSTEGPMDVVKSLRDEAGQTPVIQLPSQISEFTIRTAAQLRVMQTMSYFHQTHILNIWSTYPLTSIRPWMVRYSGPPSKGILGVMCIGEQPAPEFLHDAINGSVVAVVVVEDPLAFGVLQDKGADDNNNIALENTTTAEIKTESSCIRYIEPGPNGYPDPKYCHSVGFALIRGIDTKSKCLQLLTPISDDVIKDFGASEKSVIIVSGKLETPGWAYTEQLHRRAVAEARRRKKELGEAGHDPDSESYENRDPRDKDNMEAFESAPWVERLEGHLGRGVGERVWKVRRDLGRSGDGG